MEIAEIVLEYIQTLVWPAVVLTVTVLFRDPLTAMLQRLRGADLPGGVSLDFEQDIREAQKLSRDVQDAPPPKESHGRPSIPLTEANARMISLGLQPSPSGLNLEYYRNLAEQDPNIALAGLRMEVETLARNLATGFKVPFSKRDSAGSLLRKLLKRHAITVQQSELGQKILQLCNRAVHGTTVSREASNAIIDVAEVLREQYIAWLSWGFDDDWKPSRGQGEMDG